MVKVWFGDNIWNSFKKKYSTDNVACFVCISI